MQRQSRNNAGPSEEEARDRGPRVSDQFSVFARREFLKIVPRLSVACLLVWGSGVLLMWLRLVGGKQNFGRSYVLHRRSVNIGWLYVRQNEVVNLAQVKTTWARLAVVFSS